MSDDQIEDVALSEALNAQLASFIDNRFKDPDPILKAQLASAPAVVNALGEMSGVIDQGDEVCYAMVTKAAEADRLGFGCRATTFADFTLLKGLSDELVQSHPNTALLLLALAPPREINDRYKARLKETSKDLVALIEQIDQPGLVELNALICYSEGLDLGVPSAEASREQIPLLCMAEAILTSLEAEGHTHPIQRAQLQYVAKNYFNHGQKALPDYLKFYERATNSNAAQEPYDYKWLARERLNPLFKLILENSRAKNHVVNDLHTSLFTLSNMFENKPAQWMLDGESALLSAKPANLLKLMLNTFQVPTAELANSFQRQPRGLNLNWYLDYKLLAETAMVKGFNARFDTILHDPAERRVAYTNLLTVTIKLALEDIDKSPERANALVGLDDLLKEVLPYADLEAISPALTEAENDLWAGHILRHHRHLHNLVPLKSIGNNFSQDLGI